MDSYVQVFIDALVYKSGVSDDRISVASQGEQFASDDPKDWANDRRVIVRLDD